MDIVYTCREGENEELRYSIRSVITNYTGVGDVWVVGGKPDWYVGNFIPTTTLPDKFDTVRQNLKTILRDSRIPPTFVFMNDDFFIHKKIDEIKNYYAGTLDNRYMDHQSLFGHNSYANMLAKTSHILKKFDVAKPLNFETHMPMVFEKEKLDKTINNKYAIRSYYGNINEIESINAVNDVKIYANDYINILNVDNGTPYFSTEDRSFPHVYDYLKEMFPTPTRHEAI